MYCNLSQDLLSSYPSESTRYTTNQKAMLESLICQTGMDMVPVNVKQQNLHPGLCNVVGSPYFLHVSHTPCCYLFLPWKRKACVSRREQYGIPVLVKLLEATPFDAVTAAAADALRALAMNNEGNKSAIREAWAVPLLVKLLGSEVRLNP